MTVPPLLVVQGSDERFRSALHDVIASGPWSIRYGWVGDHDPWDLSASGLVCVGPVRTVVEAAQALDTAMRGAGVVIHVRAEPAATARLLDDLGRIGPFEHRGGTTLTEEQRRLLETLRDGATLDEAAECLHISRRTAARRLAAAKEALGVRSTVEAVLAFRGAGRAC